MSEPVDSPATLRVALAQLIATTEPEANLALIAEAAGRAAAQSVDLLVLPEATMCSFVRSSGEVAEPLDGPWAGAVREIAATHRLTIVAGMFTTTTTERVRNTLLVTGAAETSYDKIHLFDALGFAESRRIEPGAGPVTFDLAGFRAGLATCYDVRFPALFTALARRGAQLIVVPASWASGPGKVHQWRTLVTARAMDSTSFVIGVNQAAPPGATPGSPVGVGHSLVVDPFGTVLLELGDDPELQIVDLDLSQVAGARERLPVIAHARDFD